MVQSVCVLESLSISYFINFMCGDLNMYFIIWLKFKCVCVLFQHLWIDIIKLLLHCLMMLSVF